MLVIHPLLTCTTPMSQIYKGIHKTCKFVELKFSVYFSVLATLGNPTSLGYKTIESLLCLIVVYIYIDWYVDVT